MKLNDMKVNVEPSEGNFPATGGNAVHHIVSLTDIRLAFKVKSSNNNDYRVRPVYGFVAPHGYTALELLRSNGPPKDNDKLVIQWAEVPEEETDPTAPFRYEAQAGEVILPLRAE
ncbi:unnamed protein product, partial [Mesorhabditis belari]|uniref:MSP domain-containing protein n=1 Tax=Mesorhabditis belari TaxID=2138241 RepID=A0AAF3EE04_9BILA